jgi:putative membrane protein
MRELQWWCVARGEAWSWSWQPIPGVWLFVLLFALLYARAARPVNGWGIAGLVLLWLTLDWPVGSLGAGYLASVHSLQFIMLAMLIPALLLLGAGDKSLQGLRRESATFTIIRALTHPPVAAVLFTAVMAATHATVVLDQLMRSQLGSFLLDMAWLFSGLVLWWPLILSAPDRPRFSPLLRILYLFAGTIAHLYVGMWLLTSQYPVYATYELAARVGGIDAITDQHLAGAVILLLGTPLILGAITLIFFRWQGTGAEREPEAG